MGLDDFFIHLCNRSYAHKNSDCKCRFNCSFVGLCSIMNLSSPGRKMPINIMSMIMIDTITGFSIITGMW